LADFKDVLDSLGLFIERRLKTLNAPGLTVGLTDRERLLFVGTYGMANCDAGKPVIPATLFQIGSISKAFSSVVLLQLQELGLLSIDDPVTDYLPWFEAKSSFEPITLRHLMSHSAGIIMGSDATLSAFTEAWYLRHTWVTSPPGNRFHYSNTGYKVLGLVLQTILGQSMAEILRQRVLDPLGMQATKPVITNDSRGRMAVGYEPFYDDRPLPRGGGLAPAAWFESDTADGSISSTAGDMCCYLRALLQRGQSLVTPESFNLLIHHEIPTGDDLHGEHYGLGLSTRQVDGHQVIGHSGGMVGYTADLLADLDAGVGVVVLTNGPADPEIVSKFALKLLCAFQEGNELPPEPLDDPYHVEKPGDFAGKYHRGEKTLILTPKDDHLYLDYKDDSILLEPREPDVFLIPHPDFELFLLHFEWDEARRINLATHGPDCYFPDGSLEPAVLEYPPDWEAYPGHYRSHNPWFPSFRVVLRRGELFFIYPSGECEPLHPIETGSFRVGADSCSPEFIRFEVIINAQAMQANLSGGVYSRTFTP
jgi:CubicO group peptidase (beta-lactamase class C family)